MEVKYTVSIIIPVYNVEEYLEKCLDSMVHQTMDKSKMEVLLIDDGSSDGSPEICDRYAKEYDIFKVFHNKNGGVSTARNFGIDKAQGKYIMFIDSDDYLSHNSVKDITHFFDKHFDEVDLVTYNQKIDKNEKISQSKHFRYRYIKESGVYDLNDPEYMYFAQTHMNICVKNRFENNFKFDESMIIHEDQKFILTNLAAKGKIGFCKPATYYYLKNAGSATNQRIHPYYIFEKTMALWEKFLAGDSIPKYVQVFFLHDFNWKLRADLLWPYQYDGEEFEKARNRIFALLKKIDDDVIIGFPGMAKAHKVYIFQIKYGNKVKIVAEDGGYSLTLNGESLFDFENIEVYVTRFHIKDGLLTMIGVIKCLACNFTDDIKLKAEFIGEGGSTCEELPLKKSSLSLFASKTVTNNFKMFVIKRKIDDISKIKFSTFLLGKEYDIRFTFPPTSPFSRALKRLSYVCDGVHVACKKNTIKIKKASAFSSVYHTLRGIRFAPKIGYRNTLTRIMSPHFRKGKKIWLYCDSSKTVKDNAYYQFLHDIKKDDGVLRYYVYNPEADIDGWFDDSVKANLLPYGSFNHRLYALSADKIITSFYGLRDILSYPYGAMKYFADLMNFDVIYLQHGVLHATLPTMYSLDRMILDKEVISTNFERENLKENYCFDDRFLIESGMPRYDHIDKTKEAEKKILFAPSWRKFLVKPDAGSWLPNEKAFLNSDFYKNIQAFLSSPKLKKLLEETGYVLDFKPHPNFRMYDDLFKVNGTTVRIADKTVDEFSYSIFITDFSSFVFDFIYLKRPVLYFMPDMNLFKAGLNHYRSLDVPFDNAYGELALTADKAIEDIAALIHNNCVPEQKYVDKMNGLFIDVKDHEEALYNSLMQDE